MQIWKPRNLPPADREHNLHPSLSWECHRQLFMHNLSLYVFLFVAQPPASAVSMIIIQASYSSSLMFHCLIASPKKWGHHHSHSTLLRIKPWEAASSFWCVGPVTSNVPGFLLQLRLDTDPGEDTTTAMQSHCLEDSSWIPHWKRSVLQAAKIPVSLLIFLGTVVWLPCWRDIPTAEEQ